MKYFVTYHAVERLIERFPLLLNKDSSLKNWKKEDGVNVFKAKFDNIINESEENKSYLNNSAYMVKMYEKYGYDMDFKFLEQKKENILLVFIKGRSDNNYKLVTVMPTNYRPMVKNIQYKDSEKKIDKKQKFIMEMYTKYEKISHDNKEHAKKILGPALDFEERFKELLKNNKTELLEKISITKTIHKAIIDGFEYTVLCEKNGSSRKFTVQKIEDCSEEYKYLENIKKLLTNDLYEKLVSSINNNRAELVEKISNKKSLHKVCLEENEYFFIYQKGVNLEEKIVLKEIKKPEVKKIKFK